MREITKENSAWEERQRHFPDALSILNGGELEFLPRIEMFQAWLERASDGDAIRGKREVFEGAIIEPQSPLKLKMYTLEGHTENSTFEAVERSNLRQCTFHHVLTRLRLFSH